jgi:alpha-L-fucosidase
MAKGVSRRNVLIGIGAVAATVAADQVLSPGPAYAASTEPLPLPPLRIPEIDLGIEQQSNEKIQWLQDAKLGMFIHWGVYSGPAKGEWYMENAAVPPEEYRKYFTDATSEQFTASAYNPADWAQLASDMGAKYSVLTARHHDGFALWPSTHPNAWHSGQAPMQRDLIASYVTAVRNAGLRVGLYYSPMSWRYPGYYDVYGTNCLPNKWGYVTDPAHKENARIMKNEVYQQVRELVSGYGHLDAVWWDGGWLGQRGSDADAAFFWEPGKFRDAANEWPVDAAYSENDPATGRPLGITGLVRKYQPDAVSTLRSGWIGDFASEEGGGVPSGAIRTGGLAEKNFTICGTWGYKAGAPVMSFGTVMNILVNSWVRNMTCLVNVGPDRTGAVPTAQADLVRRIGSFMTTCGQAIYGTRGGPWNPVDGQYGFTYKDNTFYAHLLPGYSGTSFTTPSIGDAQVTRVFDVAAGTDLPYTVEADGKVRITGVNRTRIPEDSVVGVTLDRSVQPTDIAVGATATASSEETSKGNTAAKAVDGSTATRWCANNGNTGNWLKVDLGSTKSLTGTRIAWEFDATNYQYRIEGSTDNLNWSTLADRTTTTSTRQVQVAMFSAQARYVRVTVTGLPAGIWASIRSFEIYDRPFAAELEAFKIVNRRSGKVLEVRDASPADGGLMIQWPWTGGPNQRWQLVPNTDGTYRLLNVRSGKLLESPNGSVQGTQLDQYADTASDNQWWRLVPATSGYYRLVNVRNGWCADVKDASTADGASVIQWPVITDGTNQEWQILAL